MAIRIKPEAGNTIDQDAIFSTSGLQHYADCFDDEHFYSLSSTNSSTAEPPTKIPLSNVTALALALPSFYTSDNDTEIYRTFDDTDTDTARTTNPSIEYESSDLNTVFDEQCAACPSGLSCCGHPSASDTTIAPPAITTPTKLLTTSADQVISPMSRPPPEWWGGHRSPPPPPPPGQPVNPPGQSGDRPGSGDRIARYKEERRKQLAMAAEYGRREDRPSTLGVTKRFITRNSHTTSVSSPDANVSPCFSDGSGPSRVRTTRTSRLRAAAVTPESPTYNGFSPIKTRSTVELTNNKPRATSESSIRHRLTPTIDTPTRRIDSSRKATETFNKLSFSDGKYKNRATAENRAKTVGTNSDKSRSSQSPLPRSKNFWETSSSTISDRQERLRPYKSLEGSFGMSPRLRTSTKNSVEDGSVPKTVPTTVPTNHSSPSPKESPLVRLRRVGVTGSPSGIDRKEEQLNNKKDKSGKRKSTLNMSPHSSTTDEYNDVRRQRRMTSASTSSSSPRSTDTPARTRHREVPSDSRTSQPSEHSLLCTDTTTSDSYTNGSKQFENEHIQHVEQRHMEAKIKKKTPELSDVGIKVDELAARTKQSIMKVEHLALKTRCSPVKISICDNNESNTSYKRRTLSSSPMKITQRTPEQNGATSKIVRTNQEEKKTNSEHEVIERNSPIPTSTRACPIENQQISPIKINTIHRPVSILKRKSVNGESNSSSSSGTPSLPVTFCPLVVEPTPSRQGILKKRLSMEEVTGLSKRELYGRRSSLDAMKTQSILKTRSSRSEDDENEPHSILKTKSSNPEINTSHHITIAQSVINAICGSDPEGVRPILKKKSLSEDHCYDTLETYSRESSSPEPHGILKKKTNSIDFAYGQIMLNAHKNRGDITSHLDLVRPILKKKSFSEDHFFYDIDGPRPILKKKSSTDSDDTDERSTKSILKSSRKSSKEECSSEHDSPRRTPLYLNSDSLTTQNVMFETPVDSSRNANDFTSDLSAMLNGVVLRRNRNVLQRTRSAAADSELASILTKRRCSEVGFDVDTNTQSTVTFGAQVSSSIDYKESEATSRPVSVADRISFLENVLPKSVEKKNTGAVPKRRTMDRFKTQPVTFNEIKAVNSIELTRRRIEGPTKMAAITSDSDVIVAAPAEVELQNPVAENTENEQCEMIQTVGEKSNDAPAIDIEEAPRLSIKDRVKLFNMKISEETTAPPMKRRNRVSRYKTQPITWLEHHNMAAVDNMAAESPGALGDSPIEVAAVKTAQEWIVDHASKMLTSEVKGILKSGTVPSFPIDPLTSPRSSSPRSSSPVSDQEPATKVLKSVLKKESKEDSGIQDDTLSDLSNNSLRSILKPETMEFDDGVSCSDHSNSDMDSVSRKDGDDLVKILQEIDVTPKGNLLTNVAEQNLKNLKIAQTKENIEKKEDKKTRDKRNNKTEKIKSKSTENGSVENKKTLGDARQLQSVIKVKDDKVEVNKLDVRSKLEAILRCPKLPANVMCVENSAEGSTSEGESSGGREVKRIIRNEAVARRRQAAIAKKEEKAGLKSLSKTKSTSSISSISQKASTKLESYNAYSVSERTSIRNDCDEREHEPITDVEHSMLPGFLRGGIRRSLTQPMRFDQGGDSDDNEMPGGATIAERLAALQKSGHNDWRKRVSRLSPDEDVSAIIGRDSKPLKDVNEPITSHEDTIYNPIVRIGSPPGTDSILADRLGKLETASHGWKKRVDPTDAIKFSVAGRMQIEKSQSLVLPSQLSSLHGHLPGDRKKKSPTPFKFKSKDAGTSNRDIASSTSYTKDFKRSISMPGGPDHDLNKESKSSIPSPAVSVPRADDETFTTFFQSVVQHKSEAIGVDDIDFNAVFSESRQMLVKRRTVQHQQRKRVGSRNPLKALAARTDLQTSYIEVRTGVAESELRRLKLEKLAKGSPLAIEALAGLASKEDFTAINLKNAAVPPAFTMLPYKSLMLIHIKGRRHVQTRLIEPIYTNINQGDNYVLVTPYEVYNYVGVYSNVIENSRGAEIAMHIQQRNDLGCINASQVHTISEDKVSTLDTRMQTFWKLLGSENGQSCIVNSGHPDEDELYESSIIDTNMVFELQGDELVPISEYWGTIPKIEMLDPSKIIVFDFGSEMYIWNGKTAALDDRKMALKLAKELWAKGYDYSECDICPITVSQILGSNRSNNSLDKKANKRPEWALIGKITQHMETILFREKFLDWPDFSRVIQVKEIDTDKNGDSTIEVKPCNAKDMLASEITEPSLELDNSQLGRGRTYFDEETSRQFEISTVKVTAWHIKEYDSEELNSKSLGHFYAGDSYIVRWQYVVTVTGRELSGKPSRHSLTGRDRCAYFCWQGKDATANEKGAAALLTVELDQEKGPQVRVAQGAEPAAFVNLFNGCMMVHIGKQNEIRMNPWRLYICHGNTENECVMIEVPCSMRQLRSRASLILINTEEGSVIIWHGARSLKHTKKVAKSAASKIQLKKPRELFNDVVKITLTESTEGTESDTFFEALGGCNRHLYISLIKSCHSYEYTSRLYHLSCISGNFEATEILSPLRCKDAHTSYPFLQSDLYSASQPALFLLDNESALWLWQGWWPERDTDSPPDSLTSSDQTGSGAVRWQAERRAAMQTAVDYWKSKHGDNCPVQGHLVWAGLEPLEFTNLFPTWTDRDDIAEINMREGKKAGEPVSLKLELSRLTCSTYHPSILLQRPLPEGVDPTRLELYLDPHHFVDLLGMTKEEFEDLPVWKQSNVKKDIGLF